MKGYDKNKELPYLKYWDGWAVSQKLLQKLPVNDFKWVEDISEISKEFIKTMMKIVMNDIFLKLMFNILKLYITLTTIYRFCLKQ